MLKTHSRGREVVTEAIILKAQTVQENDIWVDILTPDEGRLWGVARHGRKSRKRFNTVLEVGNHLNIRFRDKGGVVFLEEAHMMPSSEGYPESDLPALLMTFFIIDLVREFVPERNSDLKLYHLIQETLQSLLLKNSQSRESRLMALEFFEKEFLKLCGYEVNFDHCGACQKPVLESTGGFYFVYRQGALFCRDCIAGQGDAVAFDPQKLVQLIPRFLEYQLARPLRSRKVLTSLEVFS